MSDDPAPLPENIRIFTSPDYVSFDAISEDTTKSDRANRTACYANILGGKNPLHIHCRPCGEGGKLLSPETYLKWMELCSEYGLFPADAVAFVDPKGGYFCEVPYIPKEKRSIPYVALCCYRWVDSRPAIPWTVVELCEKKNVHFFQALHYALAKYSRSTGHSFSTIVNVDQTYTGDRGFPIKSRNLLISIAMYRYFNKHKPSSLIQSAIERTMLAIGFPVNEFSNNTKNPKHLEVPTPNDLLWEEWQEFYTDPTLTKDQLVNRYNEIMKSHNQPVPAQMEIANVA